VASEEELQDLLVKGEVDSVAVTATLEVARDSSPEGDMVVVMTATAAVLVVVVAVSEVATAVASKVGAAIDQTVPDPDTIEVRHYDNDVVLRCLAAPGWENPE
jgi:hypothetical protein